MSDKIKQIRIKRLSEVVKKDGSIANFCKNRIAEGADKPNDPTYVSQLLNGHRSFGENAARSMEKRAGLPEYYFDREDITLDTTIFSTDNEFKKLLMSIISSLPDEDLNISKVNLLKEALKTKNEDVPKSTTVLHALNHPSQSYQVNKEEKKQGNGQ